MADIYVFDSRCEDFTTFGLVGALTPESCVFEEAANGMSEITLVHPADDLGKFSALVNHNQILVEVPVRTTPEISGNAIVTSVEQWNVRSKSTTTRAQRTLYKKHGGSAKIKVVPGGTTVTVVKKGEERYKVKCRYGTGWMDPAGIEYVIEQTIPDNSQSIESVQPAWTVKPQVFRIYDVQRGMDSVTVCARHISYDLLHNITNVKKTGSVTCGDALNAIMYGCVSAHDFEAYTNIEDKRTGIIWNYENPISALLDPETGLTSLYSAALVRDNWEMYVLHDPGMNRGVTVEYGKNMLGVKYTETYDNVTTRVVPIGETKDGEPLLLSGDTPWKDSPLINDYPVVYTRTLQCTDCKVGTDGVTTAIARARMEEQALQVFERGGDLPDVELTVDFISLGDTAEYPQYKDLERCFLWDYILVRNRRTGIDVTSRIVSIRWDCMLDRMISMEVGAVGKTLANTGISTWQIPNGFSGSKIAGGTIGNAALQSDIISTRHLQAESVNADAVQAEVFTGEKAVIGAITAITGAFNKITVSDELYAAFANVVKLAAGSIESGNISTDQLAAVMADIVTLTAKTGEFDLATIKNLLTEVFNLEQGYAGTISITNLIVTSANLLNATVGKLVLKGPDGTYYRVFVGTDGKIQTEQVQPTDEEIEAGQTGGGQNIVETTVNAELIHGQTITGQQGNFNSILTQALNAGSITAQDAFIASATVPLFYTTAIKAVGDTLDLSANKTIQFVVGELGEKSEIYRQDAMPDGVEVGDLWVEPSTGYTYQLSSDDIPENVLPTFSVNDAGELMYEFAEGQVPFEISINEDGDLVYSGTTLSLAINEDGEIYVKGQWVRVLDNDLYDELGNIKSNTITREEFHRFMQFDVNTGLTIGASNSSSELLLNEAGVWVKVGGQPYSRFAANYVQFGNYQIRKSANGALVFKLAPAEGSEGISALSLR